VQIQKICPFWLSAWEHSYVVVGQQVQQLGRRLLLVGQHLLQEIVGQTYHLDGLDVTESHRLELVVGYPLLGAFVAFALQDTQTLLHHLVTARLDRTRTHITKLADY
jgi:hypothetical protein